MLQKLLKKHDRKLTYKRNNDGSVSIIRRSPFDKQREHTVLSLENSYVGSGKWIVRKLISMDTTRNDIVGRVLRHNWKLREQRPDTHIHREIAEFMLSGGSVVL